jgi:hypothetical protein
MASLTLSNSGKPDNLIRIWAYPGETPVLDFSSGASDGVSLRGSYYHLKGLEEKNASHNGIYIAGSNNIIENCSIHNNRNTGLHIGKQSTPTDVSNTLVKNCDSYLNYDPPIGGDADGFGVKYSVGTGNRFVGCRTYNNSDDGWDLWMASNTVEIDSCFAFGNGVDTWHSGSFNGNGNGFKLGGNYVAAHHIVRACVAFDNAGNTGRGFDENNNVAGQTLYNCTAYRNTGDNFHFENTVSQGEHMIKNCISFRGTVSITSGRQQANSWTLHTATESDFLSIDTALALAPRNSDGTLPKNIFLRLAPSSPFIDAGVYVGLPFNGSAPDLGAFEAETPTLVTNGKEIPNAFGLLQNFPNPFNPATTVQYAVPYKSRIRVLVYSIFGKLVAQLADGIRETGFHTEVWNSIDASGIYFCRLEGVAVDNPSKCFADVKKMVLLK